MGNRSKSCLRRSIQEYEQLTGTVGNDDVGQTRRGALAMQIRGDDFSRIGPEAEPYGRLERAVSIPREHAEALFVYLPEVGNFVAVQIGIDQASGLR